MILINVGNSEVAEQVVHMMLSGGEVAVKLAGSAAKNAAVMLLALARNHKKDYGKTTPHISFVFLISSKKQRNLL